MCDWCEADADFEQRATSAPGNQTAVYVTNRETNETRKYNKKLIVDDLVDGTQYTVVVTTAPFLDAEKPAFEQAVEAATTSLVVISRDELAGLSGGLGKAGSVVGDIANGYIGNRLITSTQVRLGALGLFPSAVFVNEQAGTNIQNVGPGTTIRVAGLAIEINYPDGSNISFRKQASDGAFVDFSVVDADGKLIALENPPGGRSIDAAAFADRNHGFGGSGAREAASSLIEYLAQKGVEPCSVTMSTDDDATYVAVVCKKA